MNNIGHGKPLSSGGAVYNAGKYGVAMKSVAMPSTKGARVKISSAYEQFKYKTQRTVK